MGKLSPALEIAPGDVPRLPRIFRRDAISPEGFVESVQAARLPAGAAQGRTPEGFARELLDRYVLDIGRTAAPFVKGEIAAGGESRLSIAGRVLIEMGHAETVQGPRAAATRKVEGGLLVLPGDRGTGRLSVEIIPDGTDWIVAVRLSDYRSRIRGGEKQSRLRERIYLETQSRLHRMVGVRFLRAIAAARQCARGTT